MTFFYITELIFKTELIEDFDYYGAAVSFLLWLFSGVFWLLHPPFVASITILDL